jgi:hypothetical protein
LVLSLHLLFKRGSNRSGILTNNNTSLAVLPVTNGSNYQLGILALGAGVGAFAISNKSISPFFEYMVVDFLTSCYFLVHCRRFKRNKLIDKHQH